MNKELLEEATTAANITFLQKANDELNNTCFMKLGFGGRMLEFNGSQKETRLQNSFIIW